METPQVANQLMDGEGTILIDDDFMTLKRSPYCWPAGSRLNIKTVLSTYGDFHVKDKTAVRTSYL